MTPTVRLERWSDFFDHTPTEEEKERLEIEAAASFREAHPAFHPYLNIEENCERLERFLHNEYNVPMTHRNLSFAFNALVRAKRLIEPEAEPAPEPENIVTVPVVAAQVAPPTATEAKLLKSVRDYEGLSDAERKDRDRRLRQAAIAQRPQRKGNEPPVV